MLWYKHQMQVKSSLHGDGPRLASHDLAQHASPQAVRDHTTAWERANPGQRRNVTSIESFTSGVPKKMVGGKAYW